MTSVRCRISVSLDGFVAGPNQSLENPIGENGTRLHGWAFATESWRAQHGLDGGESNADSDVLDEVVDGVGAYIMGRKMFGGSRGAWDPGYLAAVLLDELCLHVVPITLGSGERLLDDAGKLTLEPIEVIASPSVTHIRYTVVR